MFGNKRKGLSEEQRLINAKMQSEIKLEQKEFELALPRFMEKYKALVKEEKIDFGIRWMFDKVIGPIPKIVPIYIKRDLDAIAQREAQQKVIKEPKGGVIKG